MKTAVFLLIVFATNIIQSITGFAGTLLAMPPSMLLLGVEPAKAVLNAMGLAASLLIVIGDRKSVNRRELLRMSLFMAGGIAIGLLLLQIVQMDFLLLLYGAFIIAFALYKMLRKNSGPPSSQALQAVILLAAGIIHGMFISGGSLLVIYAVSALPEKREFRATLSGVWVALNTLLLCQHAVSGYFTTPTILLTLASLIPLFLGVRLGTRLHDKVKQQTFLRMTYVLLLVSGCLLLL